MLNVFLLKKSCQIALFASFYFGPVPTTQGIDQLRLVSNKSLLDELKSLMPLYCLTYSTTSTAPKETKAWKCFSCCKGEVGCCHCPHWMRPKMDLFSVKRKESACCCTASNSAVTPPNRKASSHQFRHFDELAAALHRLNQILEAVTWKEPTFVKECTKNSCLHRFKQPLAWSFTNNWLGWRDQSPRHIMLVCAINSFASQMNQIFQHRTAPTKQPPQVSMFILHTTSHSSGPTSWIHSPQHLNSTA